jgi:hypothetical protein
MGIYDFIDKKKINRSSCANYGPFSISNLLLLYLPRAWGNFLEMKRRKKEKCVLLDLVDYLPEQGPNVTFNLECVLQLPRFFLFCYCSLKCTNNLALYI